MDLVRRTGKSPPSNKTLQRTAFLVAARQDMITKQVLLVLPRFLLMLALASLLLGLQAHGGVLGPSNYDECLLENIKTTPNVLTMQEVKKSCARQFPKTVPLDEVDLIVHVLNSGELMLNAHYKAVYRKYYSDLGYEQYLMLVFEKKDRMKYRNISFEQFLKLIGYEK